MKKSNPHKLTIEKIENGFLLSWDEQLDDAFIKECKEAITEDDEEKEIIALLYQVAEHFGIYNSKHNERNLVIEYKKNDIK